MSSLISPTPASLLDRLRTGHDPADRDRFVRLSTPLLFDRAGLHGFGPHDAADLVQDLFADLVRLLPRFHSEPGRRFRAWLRNWPRASAAGTSSAGSST